MISKATGNREPRVHFIDEICWKANISHASTFVHLQLQRASYILCQTQLNNIEQLSVLFPFIIPLLPACGQLCNINSHPAPPHKIKSRRILWAKVSHPAPLEICMTRRMMPTRHHSACPEVHLDSRSRTGSQAHYTSKHGIFALCINSKSRVTSDHCHLYSTNTVHTLITNKFRNALGSRACTKTPQSDFRREIRHHIFLPSFNVTVTVTASWIDVRYLSCIRLNWDAPALSIPQPSLQSMIPSRKGKRPGWSLKDW